MGGCWVLEQSRSSMFGWMPRFREFSRMQEKVGWFVGTTNEQSQNPEMWLDQGLILYFHLWVFQCCFERFPPKKNADAFKVWTACWWMAHYMSKFPKRHIAWSNSPTVGKLDLGTLCRSVMKMLAKSGKRSATTYESRGRKRFVGSKFLRSTQSLSQFYHVIYAWTCSSQFKSTYTPPLHQTW